MKKKIAAAVFLIALLALYISVSLTWNVGRYANGIGIAPAAPLGGEFWLLTDWLRLFLLLALCILAGTSLFARGSREDTGPGLRRGQVLETPRLTIRRFQKEDWRDLHEYLSDEEVVRYEPYGVYDQRLSRQEAASRAEDSAFLAVCLRDTGKMIGNLYFAGRDFGTREIGYVFNPRYQKQGYAGESVEKLMDTAFRQWHVRRIIAMCDPRNENSWHLLERMGFRREGHFREQASFKTDSTGRRIWHDAYEYGMLASEWPKDRQRV